MEKGRGCDGKLGFAHVPGSLVLVNEVKKRPRQILSPEKN